MNHSVPFHFDVKNINLFCSVSQLCSTYVIMQCRRARGRFVAFFMMFLIVLICLSMNPFPCGRRSDEVLWLKFHALANSLNCRLE